MTIQDRYGFHIFCNLIVHIYACNSCCTNFNLGVDVLYRLLESLAHTAKLETEHERMPAWVAVW